MLRSISTKLGKVNALIHFSGRVGGINSSGVILRQPLPLKTHKIFQPARPLSFSASRLNNGSHEEVDQSLLRLDQEIRRTGRVARQEIDEILQDIREMKKATSSQSLMIIRCCGELVPSERAENRTKLVQEVWKTMENLNVPMDISHYNALLRVYLENEFKFSPTDFLQELSNKGLEPNRVTYQRLIARFCQEGDIEGASTILQHMKEKQLPINEHVFNALINGHARADDMESAEGILSVMKQTGLEPNDDTYVTLMCGYARKGDLKNINRIIQDCEQKEVYLIDKDFLNVIYTFAENGHEQLVDEVFPLLKKHSGFNQDATNVIFRLINIGKAEVAYKILKTMPRAVRQDVPLPSGNFFIDHIVKSLPTEEIIQFCQRMKDEEINPYALSKACDVALQSMNFSKASELLQALKETGFPIRQHYFWPYFASSTQEKDIFDGFKCMKRLHIQPNNETLRDYIIPALFKHSNETSAEKTLERLSSFTGIPLSTLVPSAMQYLLAQRNVQPAIRFATKYRLRFENIGLRKAVVDMYFRDRNAKDFVKIVGTAGLDGADNVREAVGQMLLDILERSKEKTPTVLPILKELLSQGLGLSNSGAEIILNTLGDELTEEVTNLINQLTSSELSPTAEFYNSVRQTIGSGQQQFINFDDKSVDELETMLEDAKKSNKPTRGLKKALLFQYCRKKNVEKADAIRQEFVAEGFVFPTGLQALMLDMYSTCDKLSEAQSIFNSLKTTLDVPIDDTKILHYAGLLVAHDQFDECMNVLQSTPRDEGLKRPSGVLQQSAAWKILNVAAEKGSVENVKALFNILKDRNLMHINNVTLGPLVKAYITNDDLEGALAEFERCVKEHHATPWKQELLARFIKSEDTDRLQKIIDLSTSLHGEVNTMYDLVFALITCGKLRQAKKILETPGLRTRNDKIELTCQKYLEEDKIGDLENLIQVTKDLANIDRCSMYFYLLQAYCKSNDTDKALSVWTTLQEENIQPSTELLIYLADFLRKNNKTVPFIVPKESSKDLSQSPSGGNKESGSEKPLLRQFRRALEENRIDTALQMKQKLEGSSEKIGISDLSSLIDKLARAERLGEATRLTEEMLNNGIYPHPKTLRFLVGRLSSAGSIDVLNQLESKLTPDLKRLVMINTRLCVAHINSGRGREYFDNHFKQGIENYDADAADQQIFPMAGGTYILSRHEELLTEFEELAAKAEKKGILTLYNSLWNFHLTKKNFDKARDVWNGKLKNSSRVLFRSVIVEAKVKEDEHMLKELASQISNAENIQQMGKALVHGSVVEILCGKGKVDEGLNYLDSQLKENFKIEDFPTGVLINIKNLVENANKTFPHAIPQRTRAKRSEYEEAE